jgi:hypothetical protein
MSVKTSNAKFKQHPLSSFGDETDPRTETTSQFPFILCTLCKQSVKRPKLWYQFYTHNVANILDRRNARQLKQILVLSAFVSPHAHTNSVPVLHMFHCSTDWLLQDTSQHIQANVGIVAHPLTIFLKRNINSNPTTPGTRLIQFHRSRLVSEVTYFESRPCNRLSWLRFIIYVHCLTYLERLHRM